MMHEQNLLEKIDLYLDKQLQGKELEDFEKALAEDDSLRAKVEMQKEANDLIIQYRLSKVKEISKLYSEQELKPNLFKKYIIGGAILLVSALLLFFSLHKEDTKPRIVNSEKKDSSVSSPQDIQMEEEVKPNGNPYTGYHKNKVHVNDKNSYLDSLGIISPDEITDPLEDTVFTLKIRNPKEEDVKQVAPIVDPCYGIQISAEVETDASCEGQSNGKLEIYQIKGGQGPYQFSLGDNEFKDDYLFNNLESGTYSIIIKDKNGCVSNLKKPVKVESKLCDTDGKYAIQPLNGENWKFPLNGETNAKVRIYDKTGVIVYSVEIQNGYPEEWNGKELNGSMVEPGRYVYTIEFPNGKVHKGTITIML